MYSTASVLIYGHNSSLLETRSWILEKAGFAVNRADSLAQVERLLAGGRKDVLLLCHTLSTEDCVAVERMLEGLCPALKVLALMTRTEACHGPVDASLLSLPTEPSRMVTTLQQLLQGYDSQLQTAQPQ